MARNYSKNTLWPLTENVLRLFLGFFVTIEVANYLGADQYGQLSYAIAILSFLLILASLGMKSVLVRELVMSPADSSRLLFNAFWVQTLAGVSLYILVLSFTYLLDAGDEGFFLLPIVCAILVFQSFGIIDCYFQSVVKIPHITASNVFALIVFSAIRITFIVQGMPLVYFAYAYALEFLLKYALYSLQLVRYAPKVAKGVFGERKLDFSTVSALVSSSWPYILSSSSYIIMMRSDVLMLHYYTQDFGLVGNLGIAQTIYFALYAIGAVITTSLFPRLIDENGQISTGNFVWLYRLTIGVAVAIIIAYGLVGEYILSLVLSDHYVDALLIMFVIVASLLPSYINLVAGKWYLVKKLERLFLLRAIFGALTNVLLNFLLIPPLGIYGCAIATLLSLSLMAFVFDLFFARSRENVFLMWRALGFAARRA